MSWLIEGAKNEVRWDGDAWVRVWVTIDDMISHEKVVPIKQDYDQKVEAIKVSEADPDDKVKELQKVREEAVKKLQGMCEEITRDIAGDKCNEMSAHAETHWGIKIDIELKQSDRGHINWESILFDPDVSDERVELGLE